MEGKLLNIVLGAITLLSFVWAYLSENNRIIAIIIGFLLIVLILISERNEKLNALSEEQKKMGEKLKIHEQLTDMKADIKELQRKVFKK